MQGLPLPKHLQGPEAEETPPLLPSGVTPRLEDVLDGLDVAAEEEDDDSAVSHDEDEEDQTLAEVMARFYTATDEEKDNEYLQAIADASEAESDGEDLFEEGGQDELPRSSPSGSNLGGKQGA